MSTDIKKLAHGTTLFHGKYKIERFISAGGFGNTYEAIDTSFEERVAIKELFIKGICDRADNSNDVNISITDNRATFDAHLDHFKKEARRLRGIQHKNIVSVRDLFEENGTAYYVMDFIDGESLQNKVGNAGVLGEEQVTKYLFQIFDALKCVHTKGIWHLDIKPGNIMIDNEDNAVLIDFGASKQVKDVNGNTMTTTSSMALTPGFSSTEQMEQNIDKFGPWTDLYSLGATIFFCYTNRKPPMPSNIADDAESALAIETTISDKMHDLIVWMMQVFRNKRPQSVDEIITWWNSYSVPAKQSPAEEPKKEDDSYDTVVVRKNPSPSTTVAKTSSIFQSKKVFYLSVASAIIGAFVIVGYSSGWFSPNSATVAGNIEIVAADTIAEEKQDKPVVNLTDFECPLGKYKYTPDDPQHGYNSSNHPEGSGTATFGDGRIYKGTFKDGNLEGDNVHFTFPNGDRFDGAFKNNMFYKGRYTIKEDGSYFEGTFKNGQPDKGEWHDAK